MIKDSPRMMHTAFPAVVVVDQITNYKHTPNGNTQMNIYYHQ